MFELLCVCDECALILDVHSLHVNLINISASICVHCHAYVDGMIQKCVVGTYACVVDT